VRLAIALVLVVAACGSKDAKPAAPTGPAVDCGGSKCAPPGECITVSGMEKDSVHQECVIRCQGADKTCPDGMGCVMINDGPGEVCRPKLPDRPDAPNKNAGA
jgi:hypothetical protein